jgi:NADPH:quinone reductase-like Zn-dependent oxidoreductase
MSELMRAAAIDGFGPAEVLTVRRLPRPDIAPDQVLVRVVTAGAPITFPQVLGNEFAGMVEATGSSVDKLSVGDAVLGFKVLTCYAEYVAVPQSQVVHKPAGLPCADRGSAAVM